MARYMALVTRVRTITEHAIVYLSSGDSYVETDAFRLAAQACWVVDNEETAQRKLAHFEKVG